MKSTLKLARSCRESVRSAALTRRCSSTVKQHNDFDSKEVATAVTMKRREGFGSFHSADIETLIREPESTYKAPEIYDELCGKYAADNRATAKSIDREGFGSGVKQRTDAFFIDRDWTFINHGAFGGALQGLQREADAWSVLCERQPLKYFDRYLLPMVAHSLRAMAQYLGCSATELMPLPNVTSGLNSVMSSIPLEKGDEVLCTSLTYGSTKKMLRQLCHSSSGGSAVYREVHLPLPVGDEDDIVSRMLPLLNDKTKLVIIDQITSNTALALPVLKMCEAVRKHAKNAVIVVDAAHSIFAQDVDIYQTRQNGSSNSTAATSPSIASSADIWISNCHKWLSCPKGAAVMWLSPRMHGFIRPAIITHGFDANTSSVGSSSEYLNRNYEKLDGLGRFSSPTRLLSGFAWDGCRNYSAFLTIPSALSFWGNFAATGDHAGVMAADKVWAGSARCRQYNNKLICSAVDLMKHEWRLEESLFSHESLRRDLPMSLVPLPEIVNGKSTRSGCTDVDAFSMQEELHFQHNIEVPIKCLEGRLYVRVSAHIYNELSEYQRLIQIIKGYSNLSRITA